MTSNKPILWLLMADLENREAPAVIPTLAWLAEQNGALFEIYLESHRDGRLFARNGSTVLGGMHHQQFNYLCAAFDVRALFLGTPAVFTSSLRLFDVPVLAQGATALELYRSLRSAGLLCQADQAVFIPDRVNCGGQECEIGPYLFPEIYFRKALGLPACSGQVSLAEFGVHGKVGFLLDPAEIDPLVENLESVQPGDDWGSLTLRLAEHWKSRAKGVVFGDPPAVLSQLAAHCRHQRVAVYAPQVKIPETQIKFSQYTEASSSIARQTAELAVEIGNPVIVGRQTCDGDLFVWSKLGVCMQIIDPNRPPFPVVETLKHPWAEQEHSPFDLEPSDACLEDYARQGKVLATLMWHSGEVAHNEAMLNIIEMASWTGIKMGIGVHADRYETCPQLWELLSVPPEKGGALGLIEPVLYSGGRGIMGEFDCPAEALAGHCAAALERIRAIAGPAAAPRGYQTFMDSHLWDLSYTRPAIYEAIASSGIDYIVSSVTPGRNRVVWKTGGCLAINQSCQVVHTASPFVRVSNSDDLKTSAHARPGWLIGTLDAPVVSFLPYIWRQGGRMMAMVDYLQNDPEIVNVTPHVVARYARLLVEQGYLC